jgi:hypothetical protein
MIMAAHLRADEPQAARWTGLQKRRDMMQPSDTNMRLGIADRFLCEAETGRVIQVTGSASGQYCTLAVAFNAVACASGVSGNYGMERDAES